MTIVIYQKDLSTMIVSYELDKLFQNEIISPRIRSMDTSFDGRRIIIGTYSSEIIELKTSDSKIAHNTQFKKEIIQNGHYHDSRNSSNEVWGLAVFKNNDWFVTCSDDSTLRLWSTKDKMQLKAMSLNINDNMVADQREIETGDLKPEAKLHAIAVSSDEEGKWIAVGSRGGAIRIVDSQKWELYKVLKTGCKNMISTISFSPDNQYLAAAGHDGKILTYSVPDFKRRPVIKKNSGYITHLDWSRNSKYLQSNCSGYELLYYNFDSGNHFVKGATSLRDEQWASWSCIFGWPVQGIWKKDNKKEETNINMVDRYELINT